MLILLSPVLLFFALFVLVGMGWPDDLPSDTELRNISNPLASKVYASKNELIGSYYIENRELLDSSQINQHFINALIATEDHRFYKHNGIDYSSMGRVLIKSVLLQSDRSGGGSTITQQLVKNLYPRKSYRFLGLAINKFREFHIARSLEKVYSKKEILWLYAGTVSFGDQAFGLATASKRFFNKDQSALLPEEAATLVGILKATSFYSPRKYPERAETRRNVVLFQMHKHGYLTEKALNALTKIPLMLDYQSTSSEYDAGRYFMEYLKKEFQNLALELRKADGTPYDLFYDGLKIYTSLDYELQEQAASIQKRHMSKLQEIFESAWSGKQMYGRGSRLIDKQILKHPIYQALRNKGLDSKSAIDSFNINYEQSLWTWDGIVEKKSTRIDSIKHELKTLHASIFAVDPLRSEIKVYLAGNDFSRFQYDNILAKRQAGSLFKPLAYLAALENGSEPCDYYNNELITYRNYDDWTPRNADDNYGGYLSMHEALGHSVNTVSVQILFDIGIAKLRDMALKLGIKSRLDEVPSLVLGTSDVSLFEMVSAYSSLINREDRIEPRAIIRIEDKYGKILYERDTLSQSSNLEIDAHSLDDLLSMMYKVSVEGTGRALYRDYSIPTVVYSKTGTTQNQSDGWYIAGSRDLVVGSWVGLDDRSMHFPNLSTGAASRTALPIVGALLEKALFRKELRPYYRPRLFECPDQLDSLQYIKYKEGLQMDSLIEASDEYGGWLKNLFGRKKKRLNERYEDRIIERQIEELKGIQRQKNALYQRKLENMKATEVKYDPADDHQQDL